VIELAVSLYRYYLPNENGEGWAEIVIGSNGFFAAVSDYGNYAFAWRHHGYDDVRKFFLRAPRDWNYFAGKLGDGDGYVYDGEATARMIRKTILEMRRSGDMSREDARKEWELADCEIEESREGFIRWSERTELCDWWEFECQRFNAQLEAFCKRTLTRLAAAIRAELDKEAA
jgi:hypothetical protein